MKKVSLAVADFAVPSPLRGSIDSFSGLGRSAAQVGLEIHKRVQAERHVEIPEYRSEEAVTHSFVCEGYEFEVSGRMDGIIEGERTRIEEIKSSFNIHELIRRLKEGRDEHPYCLQLRTYGYFHFKRTGRIPDLSFLLVSTRNDETLSMSLKLDPENYESWLSRRLAELVEEAKLAEARVKRRKKTAAAMVFPFSKPRPGQIELIASIEKEAGLKRRMLLQAPTGLGKTIGVLYPSLKEALARGQKVLYVTSKNSQHSVAEDALDRLEESGAKIKALTITAKSKICFKNEPICNPDYCEYAKDHYTKLAERRVLEQLSKKRSLTKRVFRRVAEENQVCPFEIQIDAAREADTVICDYNYVFAPRASIGRLGGISLDQEGKPNLVIDEAHNLPSRAMEMFSPSVSVAVLERLREESTGVPASFRERAAEIIGACLEVIRSCAPGSVSEAKRIRPPLEPFLHQDFELRNFLSSYLRADVEIQARDPILRLCFYWAEFTSALEYIDAGREEFFTIYSPNPPTVKIACCDPSELLKDSYDQFESVIGFSATLKPFDYYSRLSGLAGERLSTAEFSSPFSPAKRKILLIPQVSTKYADRKRETPRIAEAIAKIVSLKRGNYFAFFPSFDFMERTYEAFRAPPGFELIKQGRRMASEDIDDVLSQLKQPGAANLVFAVQGGVFSEGVDYPGDMVIGAFVVGPPLPTFDLEQEQRRIFYESRYGSGFDYAYIYPAMAKAVQAAGRVIRTETDRGLIVLMDERFLYPSYSKAMPSDWFDSGPRELVSSSILSDVARFWESSASDRHLPRDSSTPIADL